MAQHKKRLDELLVERGLVRSRTRAQARIMAGDVFVQGVRCDKAGQRFIEDVQIEVRGEDMPFVSRGGLKLEAALDAFGYDVAGLVVLDVGASTGGFTDCVLQRGAARVHAVDVGYGQLAWRLRSDERVHAVERTNIRHMRHDELGEPCDLAVIDCSFISLEKVLPNTVTFLKPDADVIALIKPQFEVGRDAVGKGGVVRD
ncbi:MAG: TlyA family RNA methyltransferase [Myxococcota bacterium]